MSRFAVGDGRTYLLQARAEPPGTERWISRFTPPNVNSKWTGVTVEVAFSSFEPVNQFLRPIDPVAALDPESRTSFQTFRFRRRLKFRSVSALVDIAVFSL